MAHLDVERFETRTRRVLVRAGVRHEEPYTRYMLLASVIASVGIVATAALVMALLF